MSTPILCVECARQKQPPRSAVYDSRAGDICEPCRGSLKIPYDECDTLLSAKADELASKLADDRSEELPTQQQQEKHQELLRVESGTGMCQRTKSCPKAAGHSGQCLGGKRRAIVWSDAALARQRMQSIADERGVAPDVVHFVNKTAMEALKERIEGPVQTSVNIPITEEHLNRFWNRLTLAEKADVFVRSL